MRKLLLLLPSLVLGDHAIRSPLSDHVVPSFTLDDLTRLSDDLESALTSTGLIAIQLPDADQFTAMRTLALGGLCSCSSGLQESSDSSTTITSNMEGGVQSIVLQDGLTTRTTLATATMGRMPLPLSDDYSKICSSETVQAMEDLRDYVAVASQAFVQAMDNKILGGLQLQQPLLTNSHGGSYHTISSIVQASTNLEHFHVYEKEGSSEQQGETPNTLGLHTDAGLFLAFVPGRSCHDDKEDTSSFWIQTNINGGETRRAKFPEGSVAIMLGAGAEHWLGNNNNNNNNGVKNRLRAARHAVIMQPGDNRAWYGMMHLVPESAIIQKVPQRTFADMRNAVGGLMSHKNSRASSDESSEADLDLTIGCGNSYAHNYNDEHNQDLVSMSQRRRLQHVDGPSACNNRTNFFCWMSCLDIPEANSAEAYINEGYSLYCLDPSVLASTGNKISDAQKPCYEQGVLGLAMVPACMGVWQKTAPSVPAQEVYVEGGGITFEDQPFCYGGTSMYMDGFNWVGVVCAIFLFPGWILDTQAKLVIACLGSILFGMALEWVIRKRRFTIDGMAAGPKRLAVSATFYCLQLSMGYMLMLVVMIYSGPLFISVIAGLVGGHVLFNAKDALVPLSNRAAANNNAPNCASSASPCVPKCEAFCSTTKDGGTDVCCSSDDKLEEASEDPGPPCCCTAAAAPEIAVASLRDVPEGSMPCCQNY